MALSVGELLGYIRIEGLAQAVSGLTAVRGGFLESGDAADKMAVQVDRGDAALTGAGRAAKAGSEGTAKYRAATLTAAAATERYNTLLADETSSYGRLASAEAGVIRANERVRASSPESAIVRTNLAAKDTPGVMARTSRGMLEAAKSAVGLGVAFGAFETIKSVVQSGRDLTTALNGVQAASHATDQQMIQVRSEAIGLGKDLTVPRASAVDAAQAIDDLVRSGMTLPRAMAAARPALLLASAAQVDTADSARFLGDTLDDFQLPAAQAAHVANVLAGAATSAGGGLSDMFQAIKYAGPYARAAQVPIEDLVTTVAELAKGGIQGSMAGTGLRMMLQKLAAPTGQSQKALSDLGVTAFTASGQFVGLRSVIGQLHGAQEQFGGDSKRFLADISNAFGARASTIVASLAHKGVEGYDKFAARVKSGDVQKYADLMNRGVSASFAQLGKQFTAAGIDAYQGIEPDLEKILQLTSVAVPEALRIGADALRPFAVSWHIASSALGPVANLLGDVLSHVHPLLPVLEFLATDVLATWAAFKGFQIARTAVYAVADGVSMLAGKTSAGLANFRAYGTGVTNTLTGVGTQSDITAKQLQADALAVGASAQEEAAAVDRAAAVQAEAYAEMIAASDNASAHMIADSQNAALAAQEQADATSAAAVEIAAAADAAAAEVDAAGDAASVGWAGMLGPLAAVGIGIGLLTSLFGKNDSAAKDNSSIMQGYANSLKQSSDALASVNTTQTTNNLTADKSIDLLKQMHAANALVGVSQGDLVLAVNKGGQAYNQLQASLQRVAAANKNLIVSGRTGGVEATRYNATGLAALSLSKNIDTLRGSFTAQQRQQQLGQRIERQAQTLADGGASATARQARALGLTSNAYLDAQKSAQQNTAQTRVQIAAFQAENDAASILQQALDGLAGINLSVATAQTSLASANLQVQSSFKTNKSAIDGNSQAAVNNQQAIQGQVQAAQQYAEAVGKKTKSTVAETDALKSSKTQLEAQLKAQGKLTPAVKAYIGQLYSLNKIHLKPTQVDIDKQAADAKIAEFQTEINAVKQGQVPGLTADSAGGRAVIAALEQDMNDLRQGRVPAIAVDTSSARAALASIEIQMRTIGQGVDATVNVTSVHGSRVNTLHASAAGSRSWTRDGKLPPGYSTVGERGWELARTDSRGRTEIVEHHASMAMTGLPDVLPGFAAGTGSRGGLPAGITTVKVGGDKKWVYDGEQYASLSAAENAKHRAHQQGTSKAAERISTIVSGIGQSRSPQFQVGDVGISQVRAQLAAARRAVENAHLTPKARAQFEAEIKQLVKVANRQLAGLRIHISDADVKAIGAAIRTGTPSDIRAAFSTALTDLSKAGAPKALTQIFKDAQTDALADVAALTSSKARLTSMKAYQSSVASTLGGYDITQSGSVGDFINGLKGATSTNKSYEAELAKLRREAHGNKAELKLINALAAKGATASLASLAGGSPADLARAARAFGSYEGSVTGGAQAATRTRYGRSIATQEHEVTKLVAEQRSVTRAIAKLAAAFASGKPIAVDGKVFAHMTNKEIEKALHELEHELAKH